MFKMFNEKRELYVGAYHKYIYDPDDSGKCHHAIHDQETGELIARYGVHGVSVMSHDGVKGSAGRDNFSNPKSGVGSCVMPHSGHENKNQVTVTKWVEA